MKKTICIISIFFYILFTQVYPIGHWHAHDNQDEIELHLVLHPPQSPAHDNIHQHEHEHTENEEHHESHIDGDWNYTSQSKPVRIKFTDKFVSISEFFDNETLVLNRTPQETPDKLPKHFLSDNLSNRAPPSCC